jgi:hypothetical protein
MIGDDINQQFQNQAQQTFRADGQVSIFFERKLTKYFYLFFRV